MSARLFMKFLSGMSRSRSPHGAHVSASVRSCSPVIGGAPEGGFMTLRNLLHGAYLRRGMEVPINREIHGDVARYWNISPRTCAVAKTSYPGTGVPTTLINRMNPEFVYSFGGQKRLFSSDASTRHGNFRDEKMAAWRARQEAKLAVSEAEWASSQAEMAKKAADFRKFMRNLMLLWSCTSFFWIMGAVSEESTSMCNNRSGSCRSPSCQDPKS